jgi:hypothetical protein
MAAPVTTAADWQWPADVVAFADRHQVQAYLDPLLEATRRIFPTARWMKVYLEDDPEIRDDWHIIFDVKVPGLNAAEALAAQNRWNRELSRCCPAPLAGIFRLGMDLSEA